MSQKRKIVLIVGGVIALILMGISIFSSVTTAGKIALTISVAPADAKLTVDGQPASAGIVYVAPGKHELKATRQYFTDAVMSIDTGQIDTSKTIFLLPSPDSKEALDYLRNNPDVQKKREDAGDLQATQDEDALGEKFPVLSKLPKESLDYRIDYRLSDDNTKLTFLVTLYPFILKNRTEEYKQQLAEFKQEALKWLTSQDVQPGNFEIIYNPAEAKDL